MSWVPEVRRQPFDIADELHLEGELRGLLVVFRSAPEFVRLDAPDGAFPFIGLSEGVEWEDD